MKAGMIKLSVLYPNQEGKKFDMDYYCATHLPLVKKLLGDSLKSSAAEFRPAEYSKSVSARNCCCVIAWLKYRY